MSNTVSPRSLPDACTTWLAQAAGWSLDGLLLPALRAAAEPRDPARVHLCVPVLVCPTVDGKPLIEQCVPAVTKDLSAKGLGILTRHPAVYTEVVIALWDSSYGATNPLDLHFGSVRHSTSIGAGFWQVGIELREHGNIDSSPDMQRLASLAACILPPARD